MENFFNGVYTRTLHPWLLPARVPAPYAVRRPGRWSIGAAVALARCSRGSDGIGAWAISGR